MRPELFTLPFINISIKSYGLMMVLGFMAALILARRHCKKLGENPDNITNFSIYVLLAGIFGARLMHVVHNWPTYRGNFKEIFAIWSGGLEFLGGVVAATPVLLIYLRRKKLPILQYLDILAPALMLGLAFGRVGCFLNGCCFGAVCDLPWSIRFPAINHLTQFGPGCENQSALQYSYPYDYQLKPDLQRHLPATLELPQEYYDGFTDGKGHWVAFLEQLPEEQKQLFYPLPKRPTELTKQQLEQIKSGKFPMHPVHPAQLYSVGNALLLCLLLGAFLQRRKYRGQIIAWMLILYGITRFLLEMLRTEPLEFDALTISQNMALAGIIIGIVILQRCRRKYAI